MSNIILFRGKAATGKTYITDLLSKKLEITVIREDDIYDKLSICGLKHSVINSASYDILARIIQTNIDTNCDLIVDISLAHNPYLEKFLSKIDLKDSQVYQFLCICSDDEEWRSRIEKRLANPFPNQSFKSVKEAEDHYSKFNIEPLENEIIIDSAEDISIIIERVNQVLSRNLI